MLVFVRQKHACVLLSCFPNPDSHAGTDGQGEWALPPLSAGPRTPSRASLALSAPRWEAHRLTLSCSWPSQGAAGTGKTWQWKWRKTHSPSPRHTQMAACSRDLLKPVLSSFLEPKRSLRANESEPCDTHRGPAWQQTPQHGQVQGHFPVQLCSSCDLESVRSHTFPSNTRTRPH